MLERDELKVHYLGTLLSRGGNEPIEIGSGNWYSMSLIL